MPRIIFPADAGAKLPCCPKCQEARRRLLLAVLPAATLSVNDDPMRGSMPIALKRIGELMGLDWTTVRGYRQAAVRDLLESAD